MLPGRGGAVSAGAPEERTVLYVMGYGRSGSTILDILLQQHPDVFGAGALGELFDWVEEGRTCACGTPATECPTWRPVLDELEREGLSPADVRRIQRSVETRRAFPLLMGDLLGRRTRQRYGDALDAVLRAVFEQSGARVVVDSSKAGPRYVGRAVALSRFSSFDVKVLHLVRDGRGVAWSMMKRAGSPERGRRRSRLVGFTRAVAGWTQANVAALVSARTLGRGRVLQVRYEDLCERPGVTLRRIGAFVGLEMEEVSRLAAGGGELVPGHNIAGNRVRFRRSLTLEADLEWRTRLPPGYRRAFGLLTGPLARRLGYGARTGVGATYDTSVEDGTG